MKKIILLLSLLLVLSAKAADLELAWHGPVYVKTAFIPYEVRFVVADYYLEEGKTYSPQVSDDLITWIAITPPFFAFADDVWTTGPDARPYLDFYPGKFFRMVVVP